MTTSKDSDAVTESETPAPTPRKAQPFLRQTALAIGLLAATAVIWALYVPAAMPMLERAGLAGLLGMEPSQAAEAAPGGGRPGGGPGGAGSAGPVQVVAMPVTEVATNDLVTAIGDGRPFRSVTLLPEVTGVVSAVNVASGAYVEAGQVLATLRDEAQQLARDRAVLMREDAARDLARLRALSDSGATTDLQMNDAELAMETAELALREADLELARRQIVAPIEGWVGILPVEPGDQVTPATQLLQIDDRSSLLVEFRVPERFVALMALDDPLTATPLAQTATPLTGHISAIDNRVDPASRSIRVQATLENADDSLRAGMAFSIALEFRGEMLPAVNPLAIQWSNEGSFVWVLRDGAAARAPVTVVQRNADAVLVEGNLAAGDMVITEGVQSLRPGAEVAVVAAPATDPALTNAPIPANIEG